MYNTVGANKQLRLVTNEVNIDLLGTKINVFTDITETHWFSWSEAFSFMELLCTKDYKTALAEYIISEGEDVALKLDDNKNITGCYISERLLYKLLLTRSKTQHAQQMSAVLSKNVLTGMRKAGHFTISDDNFNSLPLIFTEMISIDNKIIKASEDVKPATLVTKPLDKDSNPLDSAPLDNYQEASASPVTRDTVTIKLNMTTPETKAPQTDVDEVDQIILEAGCFDKAKDTKKTRNIIRSVIQAGPDGVQLDTLCQQFDLAAPEISGWNNTRFPILKVTAGSKKKKLVWQGKFPGDITLVQVGTATAPTLVAPTVPVLPQQANYTGIHKPTVAGNKFQGFTNSKPGITGPGDHVVIAE